MTDLGDALNLAAGGLGEALEAGAIAPADTREALDLTATSGTASGIHACAIPDRAGYFDDAWKCTECPSVWAWQSELGCWKVVGGH